ncbi:MAG: D-cysteine desulfhydrase family protein [candidate division Zixibacteria bacterium]|nr:D-cysteine desulfhydrase family protein [candidate division Zixibacteria bacterium]
MRIPFPKSLKLAQTPTPLEKLEGISIIPEGYRLYLKRDDLTGFGLSGNKIRKLELLACEALKRKADILVTCGGFQSNHARATALLAARLGLKSMLVLFGDEEPEIEGNLFLDKLSGAEVRFIPSREYDRVERIMEEISSELRSKGKNPYVIPEGGSNPLGVWGYIKAAFEMKKQVDKLNLKIDKIVTALSSAGTYCGLFIGAKLCGWETDIIGINVRFLPSYPVQKIYTLLDNTISKYKLKVKSKEKEIKVIEGYVGRGYALNRVEELDFIKAFISQTGVLIDPVYTGKAMYGMVDLMKKGKITKKEKVIFLHTGGGFGLFPVKDKFFQ